MDLDDQECNSEPKVDSQQPSSSPCLLISSPRTLAAGLGIPQTPIGTEPRGDLDVILKMRIQGLQAQSKMPAATPSYEARPSKSVTDPSYASSVSSQSVHSQATIPKPSTPVSALKGLFTSRPRSGSRATATSSDQQDRDHAEDSFTSMGSNLLGMLRSTTPSDGQPSGSLQQRASLPYPTHSPSSERSSTSEWQAEQWSHPSSRPSSATSDKSRANRALSLGSYSLQPPPRRRWAAFRPGSVHDEDLEVSFTNPDPMTPRNSFSSRPSVE